MLGGYFPLITNDPTLTTARALSVYKEQYHPEQRFKWLKGAGILAPVLLKKPHRIEAFFCVVGLVLQLLTLVEREAAHHIAASGKPLIGLKPNHLPDYRPKTEALLHVFRHVTVTQVILAEHPAEIIMSPLNLLQTRVLQLLGLEESIYTWDYLSRPLHELDSSEFPVHHANERNVRSDSPNPHFPYFSAALSSSARPFLIRVSPIRTISSPCRTRVFPAASGSAQKPGRISGPKS